MFIIVLRNHKYRIENWYNYSRDCDDIVISPRYSTIEEAQANLDKCNYNKRMFTEIANEFPEVFQ